MATSRLVEKSKIGVYARAMFDAANSANGREGVLEVRNLMDDILRLIRSDMELSQALSNPDFSAAERRALVEGVFADTNIAFREVMAVMAENEDADKLNRVYSAYSTLMEEELGLCVVDVVTAVPLDDSLRTLIKEKAHADLGLEAMLKESIDESILGGIIMSVRGMRIDASMISQLNRARIKLKESDGGES